MFFSTLLVFPCFILLHFLRLNACITRPLAVAPTQAPARPLLSSAKPSTSFLMSAQARPGPVRVLILWLSEDPALNSSCNTGKRSNWGIFYIINSGEQPSHSPSPLPLHFYLLYSHSHTFLLPNLFFHIFFFLPLPYILRICFHLFFAEVIFFLIH